MNNKVKIFAIFVVFLGLISQAVAAPWSNPLKKAISKSDISKKAMVTASFKEVNSGVEELELDSNLPMTPASIQKLVTLIPSLEQLGYNYEFRTQIYKDKKGTVYLRLGADPYFTSKDLKNLIRALNRYNISEVKEFWIDDYIVDDNEWGEGWQWDDDLNPLMPKFSAYNIDKNLLTIDISPTKNGAPAEVLTTVFYPTAFINNVVTGKGPRVTLSRKNYISPNVINIDGAVTSNFQTSIPVNSPKRYFTLRLEDILRKQKVKYYGKFDSKKLPNGTYMLDEAKHSMAYLAEDVLKNSNNLAAETVFKVAGGSYKDSVGTIDSAVEMMENYYESEGIKTDSIRVVDGSGVSKNNLLTSNFVTDVLVNQSKKDNFKTFRSYLASPGKGTLTNRMLYFKDRLWAKTGTLSNISALAGYLVAKNGKTYAFCIMIEDSKSTDSDRKGLEEYILREAYETLK